VRARARAEFDGQRKGEKRQLGLDDDDDGGSECVCVWTNRYYTHRLTPVWNN